MCILLTLLCVLCLFVCATPARSQYVRRINEHGGQLQDAVGVPEEQIKKATKTAVRWPSWTDDVCLLFVLVVLSLSLGRIIKRQPCA